MSFYRIVMIVGVIAVAVGWIAYAIWDYRMRQEEQKQPPKRSERLQKTQGEVPDSKLGLVRTLMTGGRTVNFASLLVSDP